jgi:2-phosphosulfolactate phosphatase
VTVDARVHVEWGPMGAALAPPGSVLVVVDVLSFTTAVSVAVERGTAVYPARWHDAGARGLAEREQAVLAAGRRAATPAHPWSLSPAALRAAPPVPRLVLPSPNGSAIAAAAAPDVVLLAACLRNAEAVGRRIVGLLAERSGPVTVVPAGERWPDGSLRPALEDLLGAGAVVDALATSMPDLALSPEATAAAVTYAGTPDVPDVVGRCASGEELALAGFGADVEVAVEIDASDVVPVLTDGAFRT